jgi:hypothetical protein
MAARLTVIMIESPPTTAAAGRLAEDIVGHLIGRPGIDMTLVRSLSGLQESSTDRLTLDGINADVAVLDWQNPQAIVDSLNTLGFAGQRAPHSRDSVLPAVPLEQRRIYAFDLTQISDISELIGALDALKSDRQIKTFSIGLSAPDRTSSSQEIIKPGAARRPISDSATSSAPVSKQSADQPLSMDQSLADIDLDDLIDQLDRSDT